MIERQQQSPSFAGESALSDSISTTSMAQAPPMAPSKEEENDTFTKELNRLQGQQVVYTQKLLKEKIKKAELDEKIQKTKEQLQRMQVKTKSGSMVQEFEVVNQRQIGLGEHHLQMSKVKLSVAKNDNSKLKNTVTSKRKDKILQLQILNDLLKETEESKEQTKDNKREISLINDLKLKTKLAISTTKHKMVKEAEVFSNELAAAKANISNAQSDMVTHIRHSLDKTNAVCESMKHLKKEVESDVVDGPILVKDNLLERKAARKREIELILRDADFSRLEDFLSCLHQSETSMFQVYNETQEKYEEVEKLEVDNKNLEEQVASQIKKLKELEVNQDQVKLDLEKHIQSLNGFISEFEMDYEVNMVTLNGVSVELMNLLRDLAVDNSVGDQQLLTHGITDRNVGAVLGLIEQRIDDLIQMSKAASNQTLRQDDFMRPHDGYLLPILPSLVDSSNNHSLFNELLAIDGTTHHQHVEDGAQRESPINVADFKTAIQKRRPPKGITSATALVAINANRLA